MSKFKEKTPQEQYEEIYEPFLIDEVIRRVEVCPQDYSAWSKAIDMLSTDKMRIILKTLIDYGKSIPIRTVERLITSVLRE